MRGRRPAAVVPKQSSHRAGRYRHHPAGYSAFHPHPLPPDPPLDLDLELFELATRAERALGRLDGVVTSLPAPDLFLAMFVRQEAVLSSQIEGTQCSLAELLLHEAGKEPPVPARDVGEVVNYVKALRHGLARLDELPLSKRLIREMHEVLLAGTRGSEPTKTPGVFRRTQNWIGPAGSDLNSAEFIPPPPEELPDALDRFEKFLHEGRAFPPLIQAGLVHAQFETIHPFLDGNGRIGRLLITMLFCEREILREPLLYLSLYFKAHRSEYYDRLMAIRHNGDWEGWLRFFLRGAFEVSQAATEVARNIIALRERLRQRLQGPRGSANSLRLLDTLFQIPIVSSADAAQRLKVTPATANAAIRFLVSHEVLREITGRQRRRLFQFDEYLNLFSTEKAAVP